MTTRGCRAPCAKDFFGTTGKAFGWRIWETRKAGDCAGHKIGVAGEGRLG